MWRIVYSKQAQKDARLIDASGLRPKVEKMLGLVKKNPYSPAHRFEKLSGELRGYYSRRITLQHRLVYEIHEDEHLVRIVRLWSHYE